MFPQNFHFIFNRHRASKGHPNTWIAGLFSRLRRSSFEISIRWVKIGVVRSHTSTVNSRFALEWTSCTYEWEHRAGKARAYVSICLRAYRAVDCKTSPNWQDRREYLLFYFAPTMRRFRGSPCLWKRETACYWEIPGVSQTSVYETCVIVIIRVIRNLKSANICESHR